MAFDQLQLAVPEYTSDEVRYKAPDASRQFGSVALNQNMTPQLERTLAPSDPIEAAAEGPKKKLSIECEATLTDKVNDGGTALRETNVVNHDSLGLSLISFAACEVANHFKPDEKDEVALAAPKPEPETPVNHYNRDLSGPTPPGMYG